MTKVRGFRREFIMSVNNDARIVREAIVRVVQEEVDKITRDCFRVRKAVVTTAPNGTKCSVKLIGDDTILSLPYSSAVSSVSAGDVVWVAILGSSMRNAIVWETHDFR